MAGTMETSSIVKSFVVVLIGVALIPILGYSADSANVTGVLRVILPIIPLIFTLGILFITLRTML